MGKGKNDAPKQVKLTSQEADELKERIKKSELTADDMDILLGLISLCLWLQERLSRAKLTVKRLQKLFGFKTESRKKPKKKGNDKDKSTGATDSCKNPPTDQQGDSEPSTTPEENLAQSNIQVTVPQWNLKKNHGRFSVNDYTGCEVNHIPFENKTLKQGKCPDCAECNTDAKIYPEEPTMLVFLDSQPLVSGQKYHLEKSRCAVCKTYFTAPLPEDLECRQKYSFRCVTSIAITHYYAGLPFKRIETLQAAQGVPLADATQYDQMSKLYTSVVKPVVSVLRQCAANGASLFFDDTSGRVLEQIKHNKNAQKPKDKKAVHVTALLSEFNGNRIYLFNTNTMPAGQQLASLLKDRASKENFKTMSDASPSNFPKLEEGLAARWVITLCLSHARRRFVELLNGTDEDTQLILDLIGQVYHNERHCKDNQLDDERRLIYHQVHSAAAIDSMRTWFNNLIFYKKVEPNSRLGEAILYMLKRWEWLTQFLRVTGAAIDNNICEQAIKVVIRYRNNSLFYKTFYGASIGDAMMSLLHTTAYAGVNIFTYLNTLQVYARHVQDSPEDWLPWNYQQTLNAITEATPVTKAAA